MAALPILDIVSFSTEHTVHKLANLVGRKGRWTTPPNGGLEVLEAEFRIPENSLIEGLDVGNYYSASLRVEVGRSGESTSKLRPLLKGVEAVLMTRLDRHSGTNATSVKFFTDQDFCAEAKKGRWDRVKVILKQPFRGDDVGCFGLALIVIRGRRPEDQSVLGSEAGLLRLQEKAEKQNPSPQVVPSSRAGRLVEAALKKQQPPRKPLKAQFENSLDLGKAEKRPLGDVAKAEKRFCKDDPRTFLTMSTAELLAKGVLVQKRTYKKAKELPMKAGSFLYLDPGTTVVFYKSYKNIYLSVKGRIHHPQVEPEHVRAIFKDYSEQEIFCTATTSITTNTTTSKAHRKPPTETRQKEEGEKGQCPLCFETFKVQKLQQHCATCPGKVEVTTEKECPICTELVPNQDLAKHAQTCAQLMFGE